MAILSDESKIVITTVLGVGLAGLPLTGQAEQGARAQEAAVQRHHVQLLERGTLVGAVVNNGREGDKKAKLGSIADLVIDATDGAVRYAVLESGATLGIGGRRTAVAWNSLTWDTNSRQFSLSITADLLQKMPEFDAKNLPHLGKGVDKAQKRGAVREASHEKPGSLVLVSKLGAAKVVSGKEKIGAGDSFFIEPKSGSMAFLIVASGGVVGIGESNYVVPWAALKCVKPIGKDEIQLEIGRTKKALEMAPKLSDKGADVTKLAFRAKVYKIYGVVRASFELKDNTTEPGTDSHERVGKGH